MFASCIGNAGTTEVDDGGNDDTGKDEGGAEATDEESGTCDGELLGTPAAQAASVPAVIVRARSKAICFFIKVPLMRGFAL